jgi:hypothetical protein
MGELAVQIMAECDTARKSLHLNEAMKKLLGL